MTLADLHNLLELYFNAQLLSNTFMTGLVSDVVQNVMSNIGVNLIMLLDKFRDNLGDEVFITEFNNHLNDFCDTWNASIPKSKKCRTKKNFSQELYYFDYDIDYLKHNSLHHYLKWSHNVPKGITYKTYYQKYIDKDLI